MRTGISVGRDWRVSGRERSGFRRRTVGVENGAYAVGQADGGGEGECAVTEEDRGGDSVGIYCIEMDILGLEAL